MRAVVRMDPLKEFGRRKGLLRIEAKNLRSVVAALRGIGASIPFESNHSSRCQRFLESRLALKESGLVMTPLREERGKNECAERGSQNAGLGAQDVLFDWEVGIAEITDAKGRHPNQCKGNDECGGCGKERAATGREPQQQRKQQRQLARTIPQCPAAEK